MEELNGVVTQKIEVAPDLIVLQVTPRDWDLPNLRRANLRCSGCHPRHPGQPGQTRRTKSPTRIGWVVSLFDMCIKGRPRGALEVPGRTGVLPSSIRERSSFLPSSAYSATIFSAIRSPLWAPAELGVS